MRRTIITITDSKKSVIEKKEFSKEQGEEAMKYLGRVVRNYIEQGYNSKHRKTKDALTVRIEFHKPFEDKIMVELKAFDD